MATSKVTFTRSDGNLRSPLIGQDHISGLLFDVKKLPGSTAEGDVHQIFSVKEAEKMGVTAYKEGEESYEFGIPHLHISEFFRINPSGSLYVMFADCSVNWNAIVTMQRIAQGAIRQIGIWTPLNIWDKGSVETDPYSISIVPDINAVADILAANNQPLSILLSANTAGIADNGVTKMTLIPTCIGSSPRVTILIGQGNSKLVQDIQFNVTKNVAVGWVGAALGVVSIANVSESPAWVGKFNMNGGNMNSVAMGFGDVTKLENSLTSILPLESISPQQLDELDDKGYVFPIQYTDKQGTFWSKDRTCSDGDYRMINRNRTIDKSRREVRKVLIDMLNSPVNIEPSNGQISAVDIKVYKSLVEGVLNYMQSAGEISGFLVIIDAKQNVLETDTLIIKYVLIPKGVSSQIEVEEGFALSTASLT